MGASVWVFLRAKFNRAHILFWVRPLSNLYNPYNKYNGKMSTKLNDKASLTLLLCEQCESFILRFNLQHII